jgi:hypothetical protein
MKRQAVEVTRHNVTLAGFLSSVRSACENKGMSCDIDRDEFEYPSSPSSTSYYVKDGIKYYSFNHDRVVEHDGQDAACEAEVCRTLPLDYQTYIKGWDGDVFNEICEFTFDDEKKGSGYYYQLVIEKD